jgi:hypothetical protein
MIKRISEILIITSSALIVILLLLSFGHILLKFSFFVQFENLIVTSQKIFISFAVAIAFLGCFYGTFWSFKEKSKTKSVIVLILFFASWLISYHVSGIFFAVNNDIKDLYNYLTADKNYLGWVGTVHRYDEELGYSSIPGSSGTIIKPLMRPIPVRYNEYGFRVSAADRSKDYIDPGKKSILYLGCSFTFGDGCTAEETFPYISADSLGMNSLNAGICGYGLSQMVILAEKLIPKYRPEFVVVQFSPWLVDRSLAPIAPSYIGLIPNAYFSTDKKRNIFIEKPIFETEVFNLNKDEIKNKYSGKIIAFYNDIGIRYGLNEYKRMKLVENISEQILPDRDTAESYAYNRIADISVKNGTLPVVLLLGNSEYSKRAKDIFREYPETLFANADSALHYHLEKSASKNFSVEYRQCIFRNDSIIPVDIHPNHKAHFIVAGTISSAIGSALEYDKTK